MPRYKILHRYSSNDFGPFEKGTEIELNEVEAAWLLHDSPGVLEEIDPKAQQAAKRAENKKRAEAYESKQAAEAAKIAPAKEAAKETLDDDDDVKTPARRSRPPKDAP